MWHETNKCTRWVVEYVKQTDEKVPSMCSAPALYFLFEQIYGRSEPMVSLWSHRHAGFVHAQNVVVVVFVFIVETELGQQRWYARRGWRD